MAMPGKPGLLLQKPLALVAIVAVLAVIFFGFVTLGPGESAGPPGPPRYPNIDCEPTCNRLAGGGPRPANEVSIAVNPKNDKNIVAAANDYGTPNGDAWVGYYTTHDGGKTWNRTLLPGYRASSLPVAAPCANGQLPGQGLCGFDLAGDPVLATDKEGNFYLAGIAAKRQPAFAQQSSMFVAKSTDGGETFSQISVIVRAISKVSFHDKEWVAVDPSTGEVYVTWTLFNLFAVSQILTVHSTDGGASWSLPKVISDTRTLELQVQGSQVEVDNNGTVHVAWIDYGTPNSLRYSQSTDHGASWSAAKSIAPATPITSPQPNTTYRTPTMPDMAVDRTNGTYAGSIYIWWPDEANGDADIFEVYSRDHGQTWSNITRVNNDAVGDGTSQFFPAVSVAGNGWVVGEFYDRRADPNNTLMSVYTAISIDGGVNFDLQFNLTDTMVDGDKSKGTSTTGFIGDYLGIASTDWFSIGVWCDTRNADNGSSTDIYAGKILLGPPPANESAPA
jgi:hypothetical protein